LVARLTPAYPGTQHVNQVGLRGQSDQAILDFAAARGFIIVSKDNDFRQLSFLKGAPPKVIWLEVGNAGTDRIGELLLSRRALVSDFATTAEDALLVLELREDD
jgi:predicted nuclease of predicted toxin-antitoxin system